MRTKEIVCFFFSFCILFPVNHAQSQETKSEPPDVSFEEIADNPQVKKALSVCSVADKKAKEECLKGTRKLLDNARKLGNQEAVAFLKAEWESLKSEDFSPYEFTKHDTTQPRRTAAIQFEENRRQCVESLEKIHANFVKKKEESSASAVRRLIVAIKQRSSVFSSGKNISLQELLERVPEGQARETLETQGHWIHCVRISPDGRRLLATNENDWCSVWNTDTKKIDTLIDDKKSQFFAGAFSFDGKKYFAGTTNGWLSRYDVESWTLEKSMKGMESENTIQFLLPDAADRLYFANGEPGIKYLDFEKNEIITFFNEKTPCSYALNKAGTHLLVGCSEGTVAIFDTRTRKLVNQWKHGANEINIAYFFRHSSLAITGGGHEKTLAVWNPQTGEQLAMISGFPKFPRYVAFNQDESLLFIAEIMLWEAAPGLCAPVLVLDTKTWLPVCRFPVYEPFTYTSVLSPDDKLLYTPRVEPFGVQIWDVPNRAAIDETLKKIQPRYPLPILQ